MLKSIIGPTFSRNKVVLTASGRLAEESQLRAELDRFRTVGKGVSDPDWDCLVQAVYKGVPDPG